MKNIALSLGLLSILILTPTMHAIVCPAGVLDQVTGSPFSGSLNSPYSIACSPLVDGRLFAAATNNGNNTISAFQVNTSTGAFTPVPDNPFSAGTDVFYLTFSPIYNGKIYLAAPNYLGNSISIFSADPVIGSLTPVPGSPFSSATNPYPVAYSPIIDKKLFLAVAEFGNSVVRVYQIDSATGAIDNEIAGSPFFSAQISDPVSIAYSPIIGDNLFLAIGNQGANPAIFMAQVNMTTGALTAVPSAPFLIGSGVENIAFSPVVDNNLFIAAVNASNQINVFQVNTTTGALTAVPDSPFAADTNTTAVTYSSLVGGQLFAAATNNFGESVSIYQVDTTTGTFTGVSGSPFGVAPGTRPNDLVFTPNLPGGLFLAVAEHLSNNITVFGVSILTPMITTPWYYVVQGTPVTIDATISGGTEPFTVVWNDGLTQVVDTGAVSRVVKPAETFIFYIASVTDALGCVAGPSNNIQVGILPNPL